MTEPTDFKRYRLKLLKKRLRMTSVIVWGEYVYLGKFTEYDGDALRQKYGSKWPGEIADICSLDHFELRGCEEVGDAEGTILSWWWERESRLAGKIAAAAAVGRESVGVSRESVDRETLLAMIRDQMRADMATARGRKPSRADAAAHLLDCEGLVHDDAVWVMNELGWTDVDITNLARHVRYGRKRRAEGHPCRFTTIS